MKSSNSQRPIQMHLRHLVARSCTAAFIGAMTVGAGSAQADIGDFLSRVFSLGPSTRITVNAPGQQMRMRISGNIAFTPAEDDVQSLTGKAVFEEKRNGRAQRIVFEANAAGIQRTYSVDGQTKPLDAEGRRWLADAIPALLRETGQNSKERVNRLHAQGGPAKILAEIERIQADHARGKYIKAFAAMGPLAETPLQQLLDATSRMESNFEKRGALMAIMASQTLRASHQISLLNAVAKMDSSFEQRGVMVALAPALAATDEVAQAWYAALDSIDSDFEKRGAIEALSRRESLTSAQILVSLQSTLKLDSDFEHANALKSIVKHLSNGTFPQIEAYLHSARKIDSDFERRNALLALVERAKLDKNGYVAVLQAVGGMDSDFEVRNVLAAVAKKMPADSDLVSRYRRVARTLSDHERGQAEKALDHLML